MGTPGPSPSAEELGDLPAEGDGGGGGFGWLGDWFGGLFGGGVFDLPGMVTDALLAFVAELVEAAGEPFLSLLGETLLTTPDLSGHSVLVDMWTTSWGVALGSYVLLVVAGGLTLMGYETVQTRYALKQIAPRLVLGLVASGLSLLVVGHGVELSNALSAAILGGGLLDGGGPALARMLMGDTLGGGNPAHLLILALVLVVLVASVLVGYLVRIAVVALLAVCGPLALSCHGLPQTEGVATLWWRGLGGALLIQVAQSAALAMGVRLFLAPGNSLLVGRAGQLETLLSALCLFWVLWKIPGWVVQVILRGTPVSMPHAPAPVRALRGVAMAMLLYRYLPGRPGAAGRAGAAGAAPPPSPPGGGLGRRPGPPRGPRPPTAPAPVSFGPAAARPHGAAPRPVIPRPRVQRGDAPPNPPPAPPAAALPPPAQAKPRPSPPAGPGLFRPPVVEDPPPTRRAPAPLPPPRPLFREPAEDTDRAKNPPERPER
ncbi:hypothetical protein RM844_13130 [Streptomyces sp. DSM 44915]|uniref:Integral membrane protein n=1 Tax=Streptomyces chisholmiae TaxID=3075540 RepID=A0ABU2JRS0_9ACTN|nr:hypothetical protein [Streptomyces sp. DSM 44915]MDT0267229.1 hypothetical protein [Streptomyces sp. DSM 44915]